MAYPAPFHRLVMIGSLYGTESFNVTLSMIPSGGSVPAVTDDLVEDVGIAIRAWWLLPTSGTPALGIGIINNAVLTSVKLNRIATDGTYMDPDAREYVLPTPAAGPTSQVCAPQLSMVSTLRGTAERALAGRGRMYFPPNTLTLNPGFDGRVSAALALAQAQGTVNLLSILNDVYLSAGVPAVAGIASKTRGGAFQGVDHVTVGRVIDTVRSRRTSLDEDPASYGAP